MSINTNFSSFTFQGRLPKRSPDVLKQEIEKYLNMGMSLKEISPIVDEKPANIYRIMYSFNLKSPRQIKKIREKEIDKILNTKIEDIASESISIEQLAELTGFSVKEINKWFNENILKIKKAQQLFMLKNGTSCKQLAENFNITETRARQIKKQFIENKLLVEKPSDKKDLIIKSIKLGKSIKEIAQAFNISKCTVYNLKKTLSKNEIEQPIKQQILILSKLGFNKSQIAKKLNLCIKTVQDYIKKFNLKDDIQTAKTIRKQQIYEDYKKGLLGKELAKKYRLSLRTIYSIIKDMKKEHL